MKDFNVEFSDEKLYHLILWKLDSKWKIGSFDLYEPGKEHLGINYRIRHEWRAENEEVKCNGDIKKVFPTLSKESALLRRIDRITRAYLGLNF